MVPLTKCRHKISVQIERQKKENRREKRKNCQFHHVTIVRRESTKKKKKKKKKRRMKYMGKVLSNGYAFFVGTFRVNKCVNDERNEKENRTVVRE